MGFNYFYNNNFAINDVPIIFFNFIKNTKKYSILSINNSFTFNGYTLQVIGDDYYYMYYNNHGIFFFKKMTYFTFLCRYHNILKRIDTTEMSNQELKNIDQMIHDIKILQILNATFQYCPQFIFQAFLIIYRNYKCIITGKCLRFFKY